MDFANEHYVRLYTRDTTTWKRLQFTGQTTLMHLLRKLDMAGVIDIEDMEPWEAVVLHCHVPAEIAKPGMAECLRLGVVLHRGRTLVAPNYRVANEVSKSDRQRQHESRERRRVRAMTENVPARDGAEQSVTAGHHSSSQNASGPSRNGANGHARSQSVTLSVTDTVAVAEAASRRPVTPSLAGDTFEQPTAAAASASKQLSGRGDTLSSEEVARAWAETIGKPGANPGALHAHSQWRSDFIVIAAACDAVEGNAAIAMRAVIEWFWLAPDGPVQAERLHRRNANPGQLAKHVSRDLDAAQLWWFKQRESQRTLAREVAQ